MKNFFSIGELAKYQKISKQTLIFYDKIGLFRPAYVDPDNGYRYYSATQLDFLDTILIMKKIGFSLKEIQSHMRNYTIDSSLALLKKQLVRIEDEINELTLIRSRLMQRCEQMENAQKLQIKKGEVYVEYINGPYILYENVSAPYTAKEISIATKKCFADSFQKHLPIFFECGVIVPLERIKQGRFTEASVAFLLTEYTESVNNIKQLSSGTCVSTYHFGDYSSMEQSYKKILEYCERNSLDIISDSYEFCINDYISSYDENEYITKIMFYIKEKTAKRSI